MRATALLAFAALSGCGEPIINDDFAQNAVRIEGRVSSGSGAAVPFGYVEVVVDTSVRADGDARERRPPLSRPGAPLAFTTSDSSGRYGLRIRTWSAELCARVRATAPVTGSSVPPVLVDQAVRRLVVRREGPWGEAQDTVVVDLVLPPGS